MESLSDGQLAVLRWVAEGCPDGVFEGFGHRISARALKRRGLLRLAGHGPSWRAELTERGERLFANGAGVAQTALRPPAVRRGQPSRQSLQSASVTQQLVDAVIAAGGSLRVPDDAHRGGINYRQRALAAMRHGRVPAGKRLTVNRADRGRELEIRLEEMIPGTDVPTRPVPVPSRVARYHPAAARFRDQREYHEVSRAALSRATRIVHALATEAQRRGWTVAAVEPDASTLGHGWSGTTDGHLLVKTAAAEHRLRIQEEGLPSRVQWHRQTFWSSFSIRSRRQSPRENLADYEKKATGRLVLTLDSGYSREGRPAKWADRRSWTLDEKLPEILREIEVRDAEAAHRKLLEERAREERQRRWAAAMEEAKAKYAEDYRARSLAEQISDWNEAQTIRAFCDALIVAHNLDDLPDEDERAEWIRWARAYADHIDPLRHFPEPPKVPEPTPDTLKPYLGGWSPHGPRW